MADLTKDADTLPLAAEFTPADAARWHALATAALKGRAPETLSSRSYDGLTIAPLAQRRGDASALLTSPAQGWQVMARIDLPSADAAHAEIATALANGADGVTLVCPGSTGSHGFGIDPGAIAPLLATIKHDTVVPVEIDLAGTDADAVHVLAGALAAIPSCGERFAIRISFDPIGAIAPGGTDSTRRRDHASKLGRLASGLIEKGFAGPFVAADGRIVHAAGGSEAQELAFVLAGAVAYLRALEAGGIALADARRRIFFRLAADQEQFLTLAKFRALRLLWARIEEASSLAPVPVFVSAETAWRMMTRCDPYGNIVRTTIAAHAAATGGADAISVLPFTQAIGLPDGFARRIARNVQLLLRHEAHLDAVYDPARGSGAIEDLTDQLARAAWALFQQIESQGGLPAALADGGFAAQVAAVRQAREQALATGRDAIIGTTVFPDRDEAEVAVLAPMPDRVASGPLSPMRLAAPYEDGPATLCSVHDSLAGHEDRQAGPSLR